MLKVVVHSYFDMFTFKAMGGAAFIISYAVLQSLFPEFAMVAASLLLWMLVASAG